MNYQLIDPPLPTVQRWVNLARRYPGTSTLRKLQYEHLGQLDLRGRVLDLGGGANALYRKLLPTGLDYSSINIDPEIEPTWVVVPGQPLPVESNTFDTCLSMNTLEHVWDGKQLLREIHRVLKPGGRAHITVPFLFRIHGFPDDYIRTTPSWWKQALEEAGFKEASVTPLVWGRYSTAASVAGVRGLLKRTRYTLPHLWDVAYAAALCRNMGGHYRGVRGQVICNVAVGHFISATK